MVNAANFSKRLHQILEYYDLSAASLADGMHVGRSSISHILSGRNKPSLDFVMKVVSSYPEVDLYWLLNGKGSFPKQSDTDPQKNLFSTEKQTNLPLEKESPKPIEVKASNRSALKKIVLFYEDGTFEAFENN